MADLAISGGYTVEDLDWLRDEIGVAHIELDPWGSLIVSPATDEHELAQGALTVQAGIQLQASGYAVVPSMPWTVLGGTGYLMVPDLTVLAADWRRVGDGIDPPPLLVVEIATGLVAQGQAAIPTLLAEASRLIVLAGLLWGAGDLALMLIESNHDLRATRILDAVLSRDVDDAIRGDPEEGGRLGCVGEDGHCFLQLEHLLLHVADDLAARVGDRYLRGESEDLEPELEGKVHR